MLISVGIPFHNAVSCAMRAIDCLQQNVASINCKLQLNIVDDNSFPGQLELLTAHLRGEGTIHTSPHPAPNLAHNVNWLLDHTSQHADYYLNLETDVFMEPGCLQALIIALNTFCTLEVDTCMVFPLQLTPDRLNADFHFCQRGYPPLPLLPADLQHQRVFPWTHMGCTLVTGATARNPEIRCDPDFKLFCTDQDYSLTLTKVTGEKILYVPEAVCVHQGHASSQENTKPNPDPECFDRIKKKWGT